MQYIKKVKSNIVLTWDCGKNPSYKPMLFICRVRLFLAPITYNQRFSIKMIGTDDTILRNSRTEK